MGTCTRCAATHDDPAGVCNRCRIRERAAEAAWTDWPDSVPTPPSLRGARLEELTDVSARVEDRLQLL